MLEDRIDELDALPTLEDYLEGVAPHGIELLEVYDGETETRWKITDKGGAVWVMRKRARAATKIIENAAVAQAEQARISVWRAEVNAPLERDLAYFDGLLTEWHAARIEADLDVNVLRDVPDPDVWVKYRGKSAKLPDGTVSARAGRGRFVEDDADEAIAFLVENERTDLLVTEPQISSSKLDQLASARPELVRFDGAFYWIPVAEDEISAPDGSPGVEATAIKNALDRDVDVVTIIDTFSHVLPQVFALEQNTPSAAERLELTVSQELGELPKVTAWRKIPGIAKYGVGHVSIKVSS